jgi:hypothetical protein
MRFPRRDPKAIPVVLRRNHFQDGVVQVDFIVLYPAFSMKSPILRRWTPCRYLPSEDKGDFYLVWAMRRYMARTLRTQYYFSNLPKPPGSVQSKDRYFGLNVRA